MSRGPGRWQRLILAALEVHPAVYLNTLLPAGFTRAEYTAIIRAAYSLVDAGRIELDRYLCWDGTPGKLVARRPGIHVSRDSVVSVDKAPQRHDVNTYAGAQP